MNTPFVLAFAVLTLVLAVLITANVVAAAVVASYRRIGVLKSIGFTPAQVTAVYLAQISIPALAGAIAGTVLGNWWALPLINAYAVSGTHVLVPLWINLAVPLGMLALTGLAAAVPAARAGRLPAAAVIAAGQAPSAWLALLVGALACLGVLNAALMATRERVHDLGVFKAVGMTPRQVVTMVTCWAIAPAVIAAAIALPAGLVAQDLLVRQLAGTAGAAGMAGDRPVPMVLPGSFVHVLGGTDLLLLALAGLGIAIAGALGPATWSALTRTAAVLRTE